MKAIDRRVQRMFVCATILATQPAEGEWRRGAGGSIGKHTFSLSAAKARPTNSSTLRFAFA